jgi:hypothetical protein
MFKSRFIMEKINTIFAPLKFIKWLFFKGYEETGQYFKACNGEVAHPDSYREVRAQDLYPPEADRGATY